MKKKDKRRNQSPEERRGYPQKVQMRELVDYEPDWGRLMAEKPRGTHWVLGDSEGADAASLLSALDRTIAEMTARTAPSETTIIVDEITGINASIVGFDEMSEPEQKFSRRQEKKRRMAKMFRQIEEHRQELERQVAVAEEREKIRLENMVWGSF